MSDFTKEDLDAIWTKGTIATGYDAADYRLDAAGAMMSREDYGEEGMYGWEVDHIFPRAKLEELGVDEDLWDKLENLRPMNAKNNASKGDDYPGYTASYRYNTKTKLNEEIEEGKIVKESVQKRLASLFGLE